MCLCFKPLFGNFPPFYTSSAIFLSAMNLRRPLLLSYVDQMLALGLALLICFLSFITWEQLFAFGFVLFAS